MSQLFIFIGVAVLIYLAWKTFRGYEIDKNRLGHQLQEVTDWLRDEGIDLFHGLIYAVIGQDKKEVEGELVQLHKDLANPTVRTAKLRDVHRRSAAKLLENPEDKQWLYDLVDTQYEVDRQQGE